jgi:hypothetical protein
MRVEFQQDVEGRAGYFPLMISTGTSSARGSPVSPSQKIAFFLTAALG